MRDESMMEALNKFKNMRGLDILSMIVSNPGGLEDNQHNEEMEEETEAVNEEAPDKEQKEIGLAPDGEAPEGKEAMPKSTIESALMKAGLGSGSLANKTMMKKGV